MYGIVIDLNFWSLNWLVSTSCILLPPCFWLSSQPKLPTIQPRIFDQFLAPTLAAAPKLTIFVLFVFVHTGGGVVWRWCKHHIFTAPLFGGDAARLLSPHLRPLHQFSTGNARRELVGKIGFLRHCVCPTCTNGKIGKFVCVQKFCSGNSGVLVLRFV